MDSGGWKADIQGKVKVGMRTPVIANSSVSVWNRAFLFGGRQRPARFTLMVHVAACFIATITGCISSETSQVAGPSVNGPTGHGVVQPIAAINCGEEMKSRISVQVDDATFPRPLLNAWRLRSEPVHEKRAVRAKGVILDEMRRYPCHLLLDNLKDVRLAGRLLVGGRPDVIAGIHADGFVALAVNYAGVPTKLACMTVAEKFHHELSSVLYQSHVESLDQAAFEKANPTDFRYSTPSVDDARIDSMRRYTPKLAERGFLSAYSMTSLQNDVNIIAEELFCNPDTLFEACTQYPRLQVKVSVVLAFYRTLDPLLSEEAFKDERPLW